MQKDPMLNEDFLKELSEFKHQFIWTKIVSLTLEEDPIEEITGRVTSGTINIDGGSAVRRTCSLSLVAKEVNINDYYWSLKTKFKVYIGLENHIDNRYPDIIWFKQGTFLITSFSCSAGINNFTINIQGKDKMSLLNGDFGGVIPSPWDFGTMDETMDDGSISNTQIPIKDIVLQAVHEYAQEPWQNIIVNDLDDYGIELLEYQGTTPFYYLIDIKASGDNDSREVKQMIFNPDQLVSVELVDWIRGQPVSLGWTDFDVKISEVEKIVETGRLAAAGAMNPPTYSYEKLLEQLDPEGTVTETKNYYRARVKLEGNDTVYTVAKVSRDNGLQVCGYRICDIVYPYDLIGSPGETVTSILDKLVQMLGNFEYFYDTDGRFIFQRKRTYLDVTYNNIIGEHDINKEIWVEDKMFNTKYSYVFDENTLISSIQNNPNIANVKNDYSLWGSRKSGDIEIPIHMRYAIDHKPLWYKTFEKRYKKATLMQEAIDSVIKSYQKVGKKGWFKVSDWAVLYMYAEKLNDNDQQHDLEVFDYDDLLNLYISRYEDTIIKDDLLNDNYLFYTEDMQGWPNDAKFIDIDIKYYRPWNIIHIGDDNRFTYWSGYRYSHRSADKTWVYDPRIIGLAAKEDNFIINSSTIKNAYYVKEGMIYTTKKGLEEYAKKLDEYARENDTTLINQLKRKQILYTKTKNTNGLPETFWEVGDWARYYAIIAILKDGKQIEDFTQEEIEAKYYPKSVLTNYRETTEKTDYISNDMIQKYLGKEYKKQLAQHDPAFVIWVDEETKTWGTHLFYGCSHNYTQALAGDLGLTQVPSGGKVYLYKPSFPGEMPYDYTQINPDDPIEIDLSSYYPNVEKYKMVDWREIIYQMAQDYRRYYRDDDFLINVRESNRWTPRYSLYPKGYTGYEKYYVDFEMNLSQGVVAYWRELYNPDTINEEQKVSIGRYAANGFFIDDSSYKEWEEDSIYSKGDCVYYITVDKDTKKEVKHIYRSLSNNNTTKPESLNNKWIISEGSFAYNSDGWNINILNNPEILNFWFDFLDAGDGSDINRYGVNVIGQRTKATNDTTIKSIYFRETPNVIFDFGDEDIQKKWLKPGYSYIRIPAVYKGIFTISSRGKNAMDVVEDYLYQYAYPINSISFNSVPVYYLTPNTLIYLNDKDTGVVGEYILQRYSIQLGLTSQMSVSAVQTTKRLY